DPPIAVANSSNIPLPPSMFGIGLRADNSLVVRCTKPELEELQTLLKLLDRPAEQVQVRLSAGRLAVEGQAANNAEPQLADSAGPSRLDACLLARINADGTVKLEIDSTLKSGGSVCPLKTSVRLIPGQATQIATLGTGGRRVPVWARVTL